MRDLSVVIVNYNTKKITLNCLDSITSRIWKHDLDVWVVDNGSTDGSADEISKQFPKVHLLTSAENLGFVGGNNLVIEKIYKNSKYILLLNSDTLVKEGSLDAFYDFAQKGDWEISSCKLLNQDGSFQPNAGELPTPIPLFFWLSGLDDIFRKLIKLPSYHRLDKSYYKNGDEVGWVIGANMMVRRDVFEKIGFLDKKIFMYAEDVDFCWRAKRAGYKIGWTDEAEIIHIGGASTQNPKPTQWKGEFTGLLYLYKKYYGGFAQAILKILIYTFGIIRFIAFALVGKFNYALDYAKITFTI